MLTGPVPDKTQSRQRSLDQLTILGRIAGQHSIVAVWVVADQRAVDDRHPPHGLADQSERAVRVPGLGAGEPSCRVTHRADRPFKSASVGCAVTGVFAVPGHAAASGAEPAVLPARFEDRAALVASPDINHSVMLRVTRPHVTRRAVAQAI